MKKIQYLLYTSLIIISSCSQKQEVTQNEEPEEEFKTNVSITTEQKQIAGIVAKEILADTVYQKFSVKGNILISPKAGANVSTPIAGYIKQINVEPGENIEQGTILAKLAHPDYIEMQREYYEYYSKNEILLESYNRKKELFENKACTKKELSIAENEYNVNSSNIKALSLKLNMLGIDTSYLNKGNYSQFAVIKAPVSGNISNINVKIGEYVLPERNIFEIIGSSNYILELNVFERDIHRIKKGMKVIFNCSTRNDTIHPHHTAVIQNIGSKIDPETKTFKVYAKPNLCYEGMKHGLYLNAEIITSQKVAYVIHQNNIIHHNGVKYVYAENSNTSYSLIPITIGNTYDDYIEIKNIDDIKGKKIVIEGANYISE